MNVLPHREICVIEKKDKNILLHFAFVKLTMKQCATFNLHDPFTLLVVILLLFYLLSAKYLKSTISCTFCKNWFSELLHHRI